MSEQSTQSIVIGAPAARVMAAIADFASYPSWASSLRQVRVLQDGPGGRAGLVAFTLDTGVVTDAYELEFSWHGCESVSWTQRSGQLIKTQQGSYRLTPTADGAGTHVTYSLTVELAVPMLGLLKRKAERVVMDTALNQLKKYVEQQVGTS